MGITVKDFSEHTWEQLSAAATALVGSEIEIFFKGDEYRRDRSVDAYIEDKRTGMFALLDYIRGNNDGVIPSEEVVVAACKRFRASQVGREANRLELIY